MSQPTSSPSRHDDAPQLAQCRAALFDLDGTLADTAPDLVAAVNKMNSMTSNTSAVPSRLDFLCQEELGGCLSEVFKLEMVL